MEFDQIKSIVDRLNTEAVNSNDSTDALRWTQAASNAANAYATLKAIQRG